MYTKIIASLLILILVRYGIFGIPNLQDVVKPNKFEKWNSSTVEHEGLALIVLIKKESKSDNISMRVVLANQRDDNWHVAEKGMIKGSLEVVDKDNEIIDLTTRGKHLFSRGMAGSQGYVDLSAGKTKFWEYDIAGAVKVEKSGDYFVTFGATVFDEANKTFVVLKTEKIPFTIHGSALQKNANHEPTGTPK